MSAQYDAILFLSFGGPEKRDDVIPFLENVLRGKNVPRERMLEVAEHYYHFDGISPINAQTRKLMDAVTIDLRENGIDLPVYWGNRNWHPMLTDTMQQMADDGIKRAITFVTSAYSSYSGCRQYREDVENARHQIGADSPSVEKIRAFYNHPDFIAANVERVQTAIDALSDNGRENFHIAFCAHSIPTSMSESSDYVQQLTEASRLVAEACSVTDDRWELVYQSRSGRPQDPWLEPDICDHVRVVQERSAASAIVIMPIGFLCDHIEILFDLDDEAKSACQEIGLEMVRSSTVGVHPQFVTMVRKLIQERLIGSSCPQEAMGQFGPNWDHCRSGCCPAPMRRPVSNQGARPT